MSWFMSVYRIGSGEIGANTRIVTEFFITKKEVQSIRNLRDVPTRIPRIYKAFEFSNAEHLFEYHDEYHRFIFENWSICADPAKDEVNRCNAERYVKEIKEAVAREKRERQLKIQQKMKKIPQKRNDHFPPESLILFFSKCYIKKYDRWPNARGSKWLQELEQTFGYAAVYKAINYYFIADTVPNSSRANTRTLGNFITHFDDILKLSRKSAIVQVDKL